MIEEDVTAWIVLSSNPSSQVQAFGTVTGKTYQSEAAAERTARRMERHYPHLDFLVLPVTPAPAQTKFPNPEAAEAAGY